MAARSHVPPAGALVLEEATYVLGGVAATQPVGALIAARLIGLPPVVLKDALPAEAAGAVEEPQERRAP